MPVRFENFDYSFLLKGKRVFKPNERGVRIGHDVKAKVEAAYSFDPFVFHMREGGHVSALHSHRSHSFFARLDVENFFYGVGRNRVARALRQIGLERSNHYARWSTVKNPYDGPSYALPYGFVQSPILATLVMMTSPVGDYLRSIPEAVTASVYMDDIALSGNDEAQLTNVFEALREVLVESNFAISVPKLRPPSASMDLFNCDISNAHTSVREDRRAEFYTTPDRSQASISAFERYCEAVENGNQP